MSGVSYRENCEKCGAINSMDTYSDYKSDSLPSGECLECGSFFQEVPIKEWERMELDELNDRREEHDLEILNSLPKLIN